MVCDQSPSIIIMYSSSAPRGYGNEVLWLLEGVATKGCGAFEVH